MNKSKVEAQTPIKKLFNHAKNVNSYSDSATPKISNKLPFAYAKKLADIFRKKNERYGCAEIYR